MLPLVVQSVLPEVCKEFEADASWLFSFEGAAHLNYSIMKEKVGEIPREAPQLVAPQFILVRGDGGIVHMDSGSPALLMKIGKREDIDDEVFNMRTRYRVDCRSGTKDAAYYVFLDVEFGSVLKFVVGEIVSLDKERVSDKKRLSGTETETESVKTEFKSPE